MLHKNYDKMQTTKSRFSVPLIVIALSTGGRIWAVNNNKVVDGQRGATFYFSLPIVRSQPDRHNPGKG